MSVAELRALAETDVTQPLARDVLFAALQTPPFVYVPGTFNTRDLGLVPSSSSDETDSSTTTTGTTTTTTGTDTGRGRNRLRAGFAFRSGGLERLTDEGKAALREQLHVRRVFDLRSVREHAAAPDPDVPGVANVWTWTPAAEEDALVNLADFVEGLGERGYAATYLETMDVYAPNFREVLAHVRDRPGEPFLFHCTAGRDRTGVLAGLLMTLAGADAATVALDYLLSRVGTEPAREQLLAFAMHGSGAGSADAPGFHNLVSLRASCWDAFVRAVDETYGGFDRYVTGKLGFSDEDLVVIKRNLVTGP